MISNLNIKTTMYASICSQHCESSRKLAQSEITLLKEELKMAVSKLKLLEDAMTNNNKDVYNELIAQNEEIIAQSKEISILRCNVQTMRRNNIRTLKARISIEHDYSKKMPDQDTGLGVAPTTIPNSNDIMNNDYGDDIEYDSNGAIWGEMLYFESELTIKTSRVKHGNKQQTSSPNKGIKPSTSNKLKNYSISTNTNDDKQTQTEQIVSTSTLSVTGSVIENVNNTETSILRLEHQKRIPPTRQAVKHSSSTSSQLNPNRRENKQSEVKQLASTSTAAAKDARTSESEEWCVVSKKRPKNKEKIIKPPIHTPSRGNNKPATAPNNINHQHKCVLIYDCNFDGFRNDYFTRLFEVTKLKIKSVIDRQFLSKEENRKKLSNCDVIYLHLGSCDILNGKSVESVQDGIAKIVDILINNTKARICISTPVHSTLDKGMCDKMNLLENSIYEMALENEKYKPKLSVSNLYSIGSFLSLNRNRTYSLSERGEMRLYLKMKDSLLLSLGYEVSTKHTANTSYKLVSKAAVKNIRKNVSNE